MKAKVTLLGTGGPRPEVDRGATSILIQVGDDNILIDAGRGVVRQLLRAGVPIGHINKLFITHHHYDHIGDLHDVILSSWLQGRKDTLQIFGPPDTRRIVNALLTQVYDKDIEFRDQGEPAVGGWKPVETTDVVSGTVYETARWRIKADVVNHGLGLGLSDAFRSRWVCLGYRIEVGDVVIAFSGDTVECDGLYRLADGADLLIQCCYLARAEITTDSARHLAKHTLACADTVGKIAARAGVKQMILTHHREKPPAMLETLLREVSEDFPGPVAIARDLLEVEL